MTIPLAEIIDWLDRLLDPTRREDYGPNGLQVEASSVVRRITTGVTANLALIEVQASINLRDWVTLPNACTLTNGALRLRDPEYRDHPNRFYRTVER